jgi:hypothetical protein
MMRDKIAAVGLDAINAAYKRGATRAGCAIAATDAILSALPGWQPIETAPKDEIVLLSHEMDKKQLVTQAAYSHEKLIWWPVSEFSVMCENIIQSGASITFQIVDPTHWMPLPTPPAASDKGAA